MRISASHTRRAIRAAAVAALAVLTGLGLSERAEAQATPVVVELFTSQGCNSCPPADALLGRLVDREDVIALSLHVDYWDYLGWRDVFAAPQHSSRQRAYAAFAGERMVYTPQIVVQGREGMVGSREGEVEAAIRRLQNSGVATVALRREGDRLVAQIAPIKADRMRGRVLMTWYSRAERVEIGSGENRGRKLTYHNVVKGWSDMGVWRGEPIALTAPLPMADGVAVMIQENDGGPILGAGRLALK